MFKVTFQYVGDPEIDPTTYKPDDMAPEYSESNSKIVQERYFETEEQAMEFIKKSKHKTYAMTHLT